MINERIPTERYSHFVASFKLINRDHPPKLGVGDNHVTKKAQQVSFSVQTIDCITCWPVFRRSLTKIDGVLEVKELPITNKIIVVFDDSKLEKDRVQREINDIAKKAGYGGKVIFHR